MIFGFIGAGKMARALAGGMVRGGVAAAGDLVCCSKSQESGQPFLDLFSKGQATWLPDPVEVTRASDFLVLAIKPQQFSDILPTLREASAGKLFLSLAAGITIARIAELLHPTARIIRCMPNTPMQIGAGATVYAAGPTVGTSDLLMVNLLLSASGKCWEVKEDQINTVTALSGSGPAYVFHFIDALVQGAVALGLDEKLARELTLQTVFGSAKLANESPLTPTELAAQVKSPRGTTVAGCAVLEDNAALNDLMARCLASAKARAEALSRGEA